MAGKLLSLVAGLMEVDHSELDEDSSFEALSNWDSQREVELAMLLECEYKIKVSDDDMNRLRSMREVRQILAAHDISDP